MVRKQKRNLAHHVRHHVKQALVPHKGNQYRPHAVRRYGLLAVLVLIAALFGYNLMSTGDVLGKETNIEPVQLLTKTNEARQRIGEQPLEFNDKLAKAAFLKGQDMLARDYWAHVAPDGTQPWKWLGDVGYSYATAGENLARNYSSSNSVMAAWLASSQHKANILKKEYQDVGFAVVDGDLGGKPTTLVVALYGAEATKPAVAGAASFNQAALESPLGPVSYFGVVLQSMSPATLGALAIVLVVAVVALLAHAYREKLPKRLRTSWYKHHGAYKAAGLFSVAAIIIVVSAGGQL